MRGIGSRSIKDALTSAGFVEGEVVIITLDKGTGEDDSGADDEELL